MSFYEKCERLYAVMPFYRLVRNAAGEYAIESLFIDKEQAMYGQFSGELIWRYVRMGKVYTDDLEARFAFDELVAQIELSKQRRKVEVIAESGTFY